MSRPNEQAEISFRARHTVQKPDLLQVPGGEGEGDRVSQRLGSVDTEIFEVSAGAVKKSLGILSGQEISKMISFTASTGQEFLLLASKTNGTIVRLDPATLEGADVATGLDQPTTMVIDPTSGNLLVAEADQVTVISSSALESGLTSAARAHPETPRPSRAVLFNTAGTEGLAVDQCTGNILTSNAQTGEILEFVRGTSEIRTLFPGLSSPRQLLSIYRGGVPCPDSFHLLAVEQGNDRILLVVRGQGSPIPWAGARQSRDLTFVGSGNPFAASQREAVLFSEEAEMEGSFEVSSVEVPDLYRSRPINPPEKETPDTGFGEEIVLAGGLNVPLGLTVNGSYAYFMDTPSELGGSFVRKVPLAGGEVVTLASGLLDPINLVVDGGFIYTVENTDSFETGSAVWKIPVSGGSPLKLIGGLTALWGVAVDENYVYFTEVSEGGGGALPPPAEAGSVRKVSKEGGTLTTLFNFHDSHGLAIDDTHVYASVVTDENATESLIVKMPKTGAQTTNDLTLLTTVPLGFLVDGDELISGALTLAIDGDYLYWAEFRPPPAGAIRRMPRNGGTIETLASGLNSPFTFALDDEFVYWTEGVAGGDTEALFTFVGAVKRVPKAGGEVSVIFSDQPGAAGIAVDDSHVYWATAVEGGSVKKASKPE